MFYLFNCELNIYVLPTFYRENHLKIVVVSEQSEEYRYWFNIMCFTIFEFQRKFCIKDFLIANIIYLG